MAENETLHLGDKRNRRWRHLCEGVKAGLPPAEVANRVTRCVTQVMKNILRHDPLRGGPEYPLGELLGAMNRGRGEVALVLGRCDGHQYAHLLAEEQGAPDSQTALEHHFERVTGNFLDQIGMEVVPTRFGSFPEYQAFRGEVEREARPALRELAKQVAANPSKAPRNAPRSKAERADAQSSILRESLLPQAGVR